MKPKRPRRKDPLSEKLLEARRRIESMEGCPDHPKPGEGELPAHDCLACWTYWTLRSNVRSLQHLVGMQDEVDCLDGRVPSSRKRARAAGRKPDQQRSES